MLMETSTTPSSTVQDILLHNEAFVEAKAYEPYLTDKYPDKKLAVVSCMDTRLIELLPAALGLKNGDAVFIKVAGAEVSDPFGGVIRSLLVAVYELGVEDIMVIAHTACGAQYMDSGSMTDAMRHFGVPKERIEYVHRCGVDLDHWLTGFGDVEKVVGKSVESIRKHPLMSSSVRVTGFVIDSATGALEQVVC